MGIHGIAAAAQRVVTTANAQDKYDVKNRLCSTIAFNLSENQETMRNSNQRDGIRLKGKYPVIKKYDRPGNGFPWE